jgi:hypothetical protein
MAESNLSRLQTVLQENRLESALGECSYVDELIALLAGDCKQLPHMGIAFQEYIESLSSFPNLSDKSEILADALIHLVTLYLDPGGQGRVSPSKAKTLSLSQHWAIENLGRIKEENQKNGGPLPHGWVYLISDGTFYKIGYSLNPIERLQHLQGANPRKLEIVGTIRGGYKKECQLHAKYEHLRVQGEWFSKDKSILEEFRQA